MSRDKKPILLVILDGFGYSRRRKGNAIALAETPHLDAWLKNYPHTLLAAAGVDVGLLKGTIGNSEVGHLTIGSGRIISQPLAVIHVAITSGYIATDKKLLACLHKLIKNNGRLHIMGLLSKGGVHSHVELLYELIAVASSLGVQHIYVHPFLDGRDTNIGSATKYLTELEKIMRSYPRVSIGSIHGRFYAMDRNQNITRTRKSFNVLTKKTKSKYFQWQDALNDCYAQGMSEEFLYPASFDPESIIQPNDGVIFYNFRPDRARQLTRMLLYDANAPTLSFFITPYSYDPTLKTTALFKEKPVKNTLNDILHRHKKSVFSIAETEKYAHVTYFFNAGREKPYKNETWTFIPSLKPHSFVKRPEMSAARITATALRSLRTDPKDVYIINYANADMVGHSGDLNATIKAIEYLDSRLSMLYEQVVNRMDGTLIVTADHGNAEEMVNQKTGLSETAHTKNPVPFICIRNDLYRKKMHFSFKNIAGITPFLLGLMGIRASKEMLKKQNQLKK